MNIIFGNNLDKKLDNYTLLELDTFYNPGTQETTTAWCVLEKILLQDFSSLDSWKQTHQDFMRCYRNQEWNACKEAIKLLKGQWDGELDSFYEIMNHRIEELESQTLPHDWSGIIIKEF
jgi:hypothetical protein